MDKSTLETFEFIPIDGESPGSGSNQFFVVQDDGTYLINRQVQYVTEVQDVKTVLDGVQSCTVYDVSEQPFFVDVDNSSELMSVSDQFVLPEASSNLYANSYLLQTGTSSNQEADIPEPQFKPNPSTALDLAVSGKPVNNCTEITLSDEQYRKLEQKGWLLIESNDKVYCLDTLGGLRDITSNNKLIQKLKSEDQTGVNSDNDLQCVKIEKDSSPMEVEQDLTLQPNLLDCVTQDNVNIGHLPLVSNDLSKENAPQDDLFINRGIETLNTPIVSAETANENSSSLPQNAEPHKDVNVFLVKSEKSHERTAKEKGVIRIKTKLSLKDIPDKIVLGKTPTGKTLVARVKKTEIPREENYTETIIDPDENSQPVIDTSFDPEEMEFPDLIKQALQSTEKQISSKDLNTIDVIIAQLTQGVTPFDGSIQVDDYLFITKIIKKEDNKGNVIFKSRPKIWTGCVQAVNNRCQFVNMPDILQTLLFSEDHSMISTTVVHIQILDEVRQGTNVVKTSVTVHKKQLTPGRPKRMETVYACSACATVFDSEKELTEHREGCLESVDTNEFMKIDKTKSIRCVTAGKNKHYECLQCNFKFNRLSTCKNHMKTHYHLTKKPSGNVEEKTTTQNKKTVSSEVYKCNMCPSVYLHASTLSKHIVSSHVRMITN